MIYIIVDKGVERYLISLLNNNDGNDKIVLTWYYCKCTSAFRMK